MHQTRGLRHRPRAQRALLRKEAKTLGPRAENDTCSTRSPQSLTYFGHFNSLALAARSPASGIRDHCPKARTRKRTQRISLAFGASSGLVLCMRLLFVLFAIYMFTCTPHVLRFYILGLACLLEIKRRRPAAKLFLVRLRQTLRPGPRESHSGQRGQRGAENGMLRVLM